MKTKSRIIMVMGIMTIAMVTAGVPLGKQYQGAGTTAEDLVGCYTEQEVTMLMEAGHYKRAEAIELLELSCEHVITPN